MLSDAVMDSKMFKIERNKAIPAGIDDWLASFISIRVFSLTVRLIQGFIQDSLAADTCN